MMVGPFLPYLGERSLAALPLARLDYRVIAFKDHNQQLSRSLRSERVAAFRPWAYEHFRVLARPRLLNLNIQQR